ADSDKKLIQKDFTHPNADGHKVIFDTLKGVIDTNFVPKTEPVVPDEPVSTQPVETTTTTTTTTVIETTTTPPATTTTVVTTVPETTTTILEDDDDNEDNSKLGTVVVPIVMIAVGMVTIFGIVSINKNRKN
ncbi:MAG: hypothetical protein IJ031_07070, partial [Oscillospiraceae bacterium]|nr:hypothetical protein [Oscillospiraceae bacterium]